ncbi:acyl-CoA carboxylase subunit epsilon [Streptomyces sp. NPDC054841]
MSLDVRIMQGSPDHVELAALMAVLTALACRSETAAAGREARRRRAHWDRAWGGGFQPSGSWRVRDRTAMAFDPGSRY